MAEQSDWDEIANQPEWAEYLGHLGNCDDCGGDSVGDGAGMYVFPLCDHGELLRYRAETGHPKATELPPEERERIRWHRARVVR